MTEEHSIQNEIRVALSSCAVVFRVNVGTIETPDGRYFSVGLPKGFPDLFGFRKSDKQIFFIEVKTPTGQIRKEQRRFIRAMQLMGVLAGVARSVEDAFKIIGEGDNSA